MFVSIYSCLAVNGLSLWMDVLMYACIDVFGYEVARGVLPPHAQDHGWEVSRSQPAAAAAAAVAAGKYGTVL
jgi:hypothetical protein